MSKVEEQLHLTDPEEYIIHRDDRSRRARLGVFRWPAIFLAVVLGLLLVSELIPSRRASADVDPTSKNANTNPVYMNEPQDEELQSSSTASVSWKDTLFGSKHSSAVAVAVLKAENVTSPQAVNQVLLHPERRNFTSPNKLWRLHLQEDGELVLLHKSVKDWTPIWWAHSGMYKQNNKTFGEQYITLASNGSMHIKTITADEHDNRQIEKRWYSELQRKCHKPINKSLVKTGVPDLTGRQSLTLDDKGRLIIWSDKGIPSCVFNERSDSVFRPTLHKTTKLDIVEDEIDVEKKIWPLYRNSQKYSMTQLRAMHHQDLADRNLTLNVNVTQLNTIFNTAIILPSFNGHLDYLELFLRSMIRQCIDCELWQINLIVLTEDMALFTERLWGGGNASLAYFLPGLRIIEYETMQFDHYAPHVPVAENTKKTGHKVILQDFKKNHGCLVSGKRYCSLLDSEGIFIKTTMYADLVKEFLDRPFAIHNPLSRNGTLQHISWSTPVGDMFGIDNWDSFGWALEYYQWIFDSRIYGDVARLIAEKYPDVIGSPTEYFTEITYYGYIWAKKGPVYEQNYRWITAEELLGERLFRIMWEQKMSTDTYGYAADDLAIIEDLRAWMQWFPDTLVPVAEAWQKANMRYFKADPQWWEGVAFLKIATNVHLCVSEQPRGLYEAAMAGTFNTPFQ